MEFPEHDNYNIMVNLAVVSSELRPEDLNVIAPLVRLSETNPTHLLLLIFEDPDSAVAESYVEWILSQSIRKESKKSVSTLGKGMFAFTHKSFVFASALAASVESNGYEHQSSYWA